MRKMETLFSRLGLDRRPGRFVGLDRTLRAVRGPFLWALSLVFLSASILVAQKESGEYWAIEDAEARSQLPEYKTIPAATIEELTPSSGRPFRDNYRDWPRSHGDVYSSRYSALTQINRSNVDKLEVAWIYRSGDKPGNVQANPIIVDGVMYAFTSGNHVVAVDAANGEEIWRFNPNGMTNRVPVTVFEDKSRWRYGSTWPSGCGGKGTWTRPSSI